MLKYIFNYRFWLLKPIRFIPYDFTVGGNHMTLSKTYHIYNHGNASDNLFRYDENYRYFLQKYGEYITPIVHTYAFCLLPDHFHFLIQMQEEDVLTNQPAFKTLLI